MKKMVPVPLMCYFSGRLLPTTCSNRWTHSFEFATFKMGASYPYMSFFREDCFNAVSGVEERAEMWCV